jgi:hypothetical protein
MTPRSSMTSTIDYNSTEAEETIITIAESIRKSAVAARLA